MDRPAKIVAALAVSLALCGISAATAGAKGPGPAPAHGGLTVTAIVEGANLTHTFTGPSGPVTQALTGPDDLTTMGGELFVVFQNGVGPQGQPSASGNIASSVVEFTPAGRVLEQWDIVGHGDGLTADPATGLVIATVNEDANSSLYTIDPMTAAVVHYSYSENPLPHNGGTDAISIYDGQILISASAPGTASTANPSPPPAPNPAYPAVYTVTLDPQTLVASVLPLFYDEATATIANVQNEGEAQSLRLIDPDSNEVVPKTSTRFAGDFVLDSQGDEEQIYVHEAGATTPALSVLDLDQSIDDTAWVTHPQGTLYASDAEHDQVDAVRGQFRQGTPFVAVTPCAADAATPTCATPSYLGVLDMWTGQVSEVATAGAPLAAGGGLLFVQGPRTPTGPRSPTGPRTATATAHQPTDEAGRS